MRRITPTNCSELQFRQQLVENGEFSEKQLWMASIDNTFVPITERRDSKKWTRLEIYTLVSIVFDWKPPEYAAKILNRTPKSCISKVYQLFGTRKWLNVALMQTHQKEEILYFLSNCSENLVLDPALVPTLETVQMLQFLEYFGFNGSNSDDPRA